MIVKKILGTVRKCSLSSIHCLLSLYFLNDFVVIHHTKIAGLSPFLQSTRLGNTVKQDEAKNLNQINFFLEFFYCGVWRDIGWSFPEKKPVHTEEHALRYVGNCTRNRETVLRPFG